MASDDRWLERFRLELAWFTGQAVLRSRGAGAILRFQHVRPRRRGAFQPLRESEISPQFLDRAIHALKRWGYDFLGMDDVCRRAVTLPQNRRFVALTFDGANKDLISFAYPVLARHAVPFTIYVPTAFPDGVGEAWWLGLERMIARESRINLMMGEKEQRFTVTGNAEKQALFSFVESWLRSLPPADLSAAIADLCTRYRVDLAALSREASMDWEDLARLAADPLVTVGSATVNYPILANMKDAAALREMTMGKAVAEAAFDREIRHLAFRSAIARLSGAATSSWRRRPALPAPSRPSRASWMRRGAPICAHCRGFPGTAGYNHCACCVCWCPELPSRR